MLTSKQYSLPVCVEVVLTSVNHPLSALRLHTLLLSPAPTPQTISKLIASDINMQLAYDMWFGELNYAQASLKAAVEPEKRSFNRWD